MTSRSANLVSSGSLSNVLALRWESVRFVVSPVLVWTLVGILGASLLDGSRLFLGTTAVVYAIFALSTSVLFGWVGVTSFGQAAFFGAGAYSVGLLAAHMTSPLLLLAVGTAIGAVLALIFALAATRVSGVELAMLTLVLGQILWLMLYRVPGLGGESGLPGIPRGEVLGYSLFLDDAFWWYVVAIAMIATVVLRRLRESTWGVALTAVRDSPRRAAALGINIRWARVLAFAVAGAGAGLAGALYAQLQGIASPGVMSWTLSGEVIIMCLVGGLRSFWGPVVGAVLFTYGHYALADTTAAWQLWLGLVLLVVVLALPRGLAGVVEPLQAKLARPVGRRGEEVR